jgi:hypothetical protein
MGVEILLGLALGFMILGPQRMHSMLGELGKAKAYFDKAKREISSQITAETGTLPDFNINKTIQSAVANLTSDNRNNG